MEFFSVTLLFETSKKAESDFSLITKVQAEDYSDALVLAKKVLKIQYPYFNFRKIWCWFVEGKPPRRM
jgi:hypothetical protein